jgi:hypothetical protein
LLWLLPWLLPWLLLWLLLWMPSRLLPLLVLWLLLLWLVGRNMLPIKDFYLFSGVSHSPYLSAR